MLEKKIRTADIYRIAEQFRGAIVRAKRNGEFDFRDRMHNFPGGCCDDACDLLAYYLQCEYGVASCQGNGKYRDEDADNTTNHAWLIIDDKIIVDITGSQFKYCAGFVEDVYVGEEIAFYKNLDCKMKYDNYDITQDERLWEDYQVILQYLNNM
uniref:hypothetical protein n=1 Tax=Agathobacter sp. TaxID=2021311 RepID=UPI004055B246